jgi:uncharacterized metal-binding protein YceD (DUF177 family)
MSKNSDKTEAAWPVSHMIKVEALPARLQTIRITLDDAQRSEIADILDIIAIDRAEAEITVEPKGARVRIGGVVRVTARQACVVTLDPVEDSFEEQIDFVFAPAEEAAAAEERVHAAAEKAERDGDFEKLAELFASDSLPDPIVDGEIDLGAVLVETLAIGLDPYPRKPGVEFVPPEADDADMSPFAALKALKKD